MSLSFKQQYSPLEHRLTGLKIGEYSNEYRPQFFSAPSMNQTTVKRRYLYQRNLITGRGVRNSDRLFQFKLMNNTDIFNDNNLRTIKKIPAVRPGYPADKPGDQSPVGFYPSPATQPVGIAKWGDRRRNRAQEGAPVYQLGLSMDKVRGSEASVNDFLFNANTPALLTPEQAQQDRGTGFMEGSDTRQTANFVRTKGINQPGLEDALDQLELRRQRRINEITTPQVIEGESLLERRQRKQIRVNVDFSRDEGQTIEQNEARENMLFGQRRRGLGGDIRKRRQLEEELQIRQEFVEAKREPLRKREPRGDEDLPVDIENLNEEALFGMVKNKSKAESNSRRRRRALLPITSDEVGVFQQSPAFRRNTPRNLIQPQRLNGAGELIGGSSQAYSTGNNVS